MARPLYPAVHYLLSNCEQPAICLLDMLAAVIYLSIRKAIMTCRVARSYQTRPSTPCEKGGGAMDFSSLYFTKEIQDYLQSFENLLSALSAPNTASRISMEEREMLGYSVAELQKVLVVWDKQ